jgi:hypothetical protein
MKYITVTIYEMGTSRLMRETIAVSNTSKDDIEARVNKLYSSCPFDKQYYDVESQDSFSEEEINILAELNLIPTNRLIID